MTRVPPAVEDPGACPGSSPELTRVHPRFLALVVFALSCVSAYFSSVLPLYGAALKRYYQIDDGELSLMLSVGLPASMASCLLTGVLTARFGTRRVLRASAWGLAGACTLAAVAGGRWGTMVVAVALNSACFNALYVVSQAYLAALFPRHKRGILSALSVALTVGGIVFPIVGQLLLDLDAAAEGVSFAHILRGPPVLVAVGMIGGALVLHRRTFDTRRAANDGPSRRSIRISWGSVPWLTATILMVGADAMISLWLPQVLETAAFRAELGRLKPGYVMALFLAAYLVTRTALSVLPDRVGRRVLLALPALLGGVIFLSGTTTGKPGVLVASLLAGTVLWAAQMPNLLAVLADRERERFGLVLSAQLVIGSLLGFAGVNLMARWSERLDEASRWQPMLIPAALITLAGGIACAGSMSAALRSGSADNR